MTKELKGILSLIAILTLVIGTILSGHLICPKHVGKSFSNFEASADLIKVAYPKEQDFSENIYWLGKVVPKKRIKLISQIDGRIIKAILKDGAQVKKGDPIFQIKGRQLSYRLKELNQQIMAIKEQIRLEEKIVRLKKAALKEGLIKKQDLFVETKKLLDLKAKLSSLKQRLSYLQDICIIRSPIDGIFVNPKVFEGQYIKKGEYLGDVISKDLIIVAKLYSKAPQTSLNGKEAIIDAGDGKLRAKVAHVIYTRTQEGSEIVWISADEISRYLRPNQYVSGWIIYRVHRKAVSVPEDAVVYDQDGRGFVFVKKEKGYEKRQVKTGLLKNGWVEIVSGLSKNDMVVIRGAYELFYRDFSKTYKVPD